jgi:hypothetical protein
MLFHLFIIFSGVMLTLAYLFLMIIFIGPNSFMALHNSDSGRYSFFWWMGANFLLLAVYTLTIIGFVQVW